VPCRDCLGKLNLQINAQAMVFTNAKLPPLREKVLAIAEGCLVGKARESVISNLHDRRTKPRS
jgi:hypothetical protein